MLLGQGLPPQHHRRVSTATTVGASPPNSGGGGEGGRSEIVRAKSEENLSETEEAAMTLEDIGELYFRLLQQ
jgi:hypothetical protein